MGWRERDYAKWTDEERRRFLGSTTSLAPYLGYAPAGGETGRRLIRPGAGLAVLVSAGLLALGQLPAGHPIAPLLHFTLPALQSGLPALPSPPTSTIAGPSSVSFGSTLSLHGSAPPGNGAVIVDGSYDGGRAWQRLATVASVDGNYSADVPLDEHGLLQIRITFADGSHAVGSVTVR